MCTWITTDAPITGSGKGTAGWFPLSRANVSYDHPTHASLEHAVLIDFVNPQMGVSARVAVEMDIRSARALVASIQEAIGTAEANNVVC